MFAIKMCSCVCAYKWRLKLELHTNSVLNSNWLNIYYYLNKRNPDDDILNKTKRRKFYKSKLDNKIINKDLYDTILSLKNEELVYFCSNLYKIRWTIEDLKQKQVKLFNNEIYHFESIFDIGLFEKIKKI